MTYILTDAVLPRPEEETVPTYTETDGDGDGLLSRLDALQQDSQLDLPITRHPGLRHVLPAPQRRGYSATVGAIQSLFDGVRKKNIELVTMLVTRGIISPDCSDFLGATPLIAAVDAGNSTMVRTLLGLGAEVDGYGKFESEDRTALQVAAAKGNLVLVKILMEEYGASDALVAPDGQIPLRLAADNGHRDVVEYLPSRRGGEWRRWQLEHAEAMRRIRKALRKIGVFGKCLFWHLPVNLFYYLPKYVIVLPIRDSVKWAVKNRHRFGGWCKRQVVAIPRRTKKVAAAVWKGAKKIPKAAAEFSKWLWKALKKLPGAIKQVMQALASWVWAATKRFGKAVGELFSRLFSLLHTMVAAVITFFRNITLRDVWNGFCSLLRAVFVGLPKAVWKSIEALGEVSLKVLKSMLGCFGVIIWSIIRGLWYLIRYVPVKVLEILMSLAVSAKKGVHEVRVWINPKV